MERIMIGTGFVIQERNLKPLGIAGSWKREEDRKRALPMTRRAETDEEEAIIRCGTTKGDIVFHFYRPWSPNGYDRAVMLFEEHFYDHSHFFRVVPGFLVQFGISYTQEKDLLDVAHHSIPDDPPLDPPKPFERGFVSYAGGGQDSRTSQLFISYLPSKSLGTQPWETPLGIVEEGMDVADSFYSYGDMPPWGKGPIQAKIHDGPSYIQNEFPLTDSFKTCNVKRIPKGNILEEDNTAREDDDSHEFADLKGEGEDESTDEQSHVFLRDRLSDLTGNSNSLYAILAIIGLCLLILVGRWMASRARLKEQKSS